MGKSKDLATGASYQDQTESDARYVNAVGDTVTGALYLNTTLGSRQLDITGVEADIWLNSTGPNKTWRILGSTGSNTHKLRFYDQSNAAERMAIDASGRVTMPYQPAFSAYKNGNYTETTGTNRVPSWTEFTDIGSNLDASTGRFTAPVAGMYWFSLSAMSYNLSGDVQFRFYVNGSYHLGSNDYSSRSGNLAQTTISGAIYLSSNDYVEPYFYSNTTTSNIAFYNGQYSHYHGYLIG